ncbi:MAG: hypothetical protein ACI8RA_001268 [Chlamydiales bacterium]|jgi:hypothetical protein
MKITINEDDLEGLDVTKQINLFRDLLSSSWPKIDLLMEDHDWDADFGIAYDEWIQVNWELFVEKELLPEGSYLRSLSNTGASRVTHKEVEADFSVIARTTRVTHCLDTNESVSKNEEFCLFGFVSQIEGGGWQWRPPFDFAKLISCSGKRKFYRLGVEDLSFFLKKNN